MDRVHVCTVIVDLVKRLNRSLADRALDGTDWTFRDIGLDSLSMIQLVVGVEDAFGIHISEHEAFGASTRDRLVDLVGGKLAPAPVEG